MSDLQAVVASDKMVGDGVMHHHIDQLSGRTTINLSLKGRLEKFTGDESGCDAIAY